MRHTNTGSRPADVQAILWRGEVQRAVQSPGTREAVQHSPTGAVHFSALWDSLSRCENDPDTPQAAFRLTPPRRAALGVPFSLRNLSGQLDARLSQYLAHQLEKNSGHSGPLPDRG